MADYMQILKVLTIIMNISNSAIILHNTPTGDLNSQLLKDLKSNLTGICFINIDEDQVAIRDSLDKSATVGEY